MTGRLWSGTSVGTSPSRPWAAVPGWSGGQSLVREQRTIDEYFSPQSKGKKEDDITKYYFYFAFENSLCKDYISEKVFRALEVGRNVSIYVSHTAQSDVDGAGGVRRC